MRANTLKGLRVLIRSDFNVSLVDGVIQSDARLKAALPTIREAHSAGAQLMLMSHLGQPHPDEVGLKRFSLAQLVPWFERQLQSKVRLVTDYLSSPVTIGSDEIVLLENVRFNSGETENDLKLARKYADLCDLFILDAFSVAHRKHASTCGILEFVASAQTGKLLQQELDSLDRVMQKPRAPVVLVLGGAKLSTKLPLIKKLAPIADTILLGGALANTFFVAKGFSVGSSPYEAEFLEEAKELLRTAPILLPKDVVVGDPATGLVKVKDIESVEPSEHIGDIGPISIAAFRDPLQTAHTILWNGPFGQFEEANYQKGTQALVESIASNTDAFSVAGGGETLLAIERYGSAKDFSYLSMGGAAFLAYLAGESLPALQMLKLFNEGDASVGDRVG